MKANEAPEKIYISPNTEESTYYVSNQYNRLIEYTRTDAFVEKACSSIEKLLSGYIIRNFHFGDSYDIDKLIEDFKDCMKGE